MKRFQSILCASLLTLAMSSATFAGTANDSCTGRNGIIPYGIIPYGQCTDNTGKNGIIPYGIIPYGIIPYVADGVVEVMVP